MTNEQNEQPTITESTKEFLYPGGVLRYRSAGEFYDREQKKMVPYSWAFQVIPAGKKAMSLMPEDILAILDRVENDIEFHELMDRLKKRQVINPKSFRKS